MKETWIHMTIWIPIVERTNCIPILLANLGEQPCLAMRQGVFPAISPCLTHARHDFHLGSVLLNCFVESKLNKINQHHFFKKISHRVPYPQSKCFWVVIGPHSRKKKHTDDPQTHHPVTCWDMHRNRNAAVPKTIAILLHLMSGNQQLNSQTYQEHSILGLTDIVFMAKMLHPLASLDLKTKNIITGWDDVGQTCPSKALGHLVTLPSKPWPRKDDETPSVESLPNKQKNRNKKCLLSWVNTSFVFTNA